MTPTICACASSSGGRSALLRLSGPLACDIAAKADLSLPPSWRHHEYQWNLGPGPCPCLVLFYRGPRSFTGENLVEIILPGSRTVVDLALARLIAAGAQTATPGAFARQAYSNGRLALDQVEAILALSRAHEEDGAKRALADLRGRLGVQVGTVRQILLELRAQVEAGLDFAEEPDVRTWQKPELLAKLRNLRQDLAGWIRSSAQGLEPCVCLVGPANAGKSSLYRALTGEAVLISPTPGTTRDWLEHSITLAGRRISILDTAGWLSDQNLNMIDQASRQTSDHRLMSAALILVLSAPDAPLPTNWNERLGPAAQRAVIIATKRDLGQAPDPRAHLHITVNDPDDLKQFEKLIATQLADAAEGPSHREQILAQVDAILADLIAHLPEDMILADELARSANLLSGLTGTMNPDSVLDEIFSRFCIGK
jgi:tRNA modification GTPase